MSEIMFRRLPRPSDAAVLDSIVEGVFDAPVDPVRVSAYLSQPGQHMIVAIHDRVVSGQTAAVVHRHPDKPTELYIDEVGVADGFRRRGIARRMLGLMPAHGKRSGARKPGSAPSRIICRRVASTSSAGSAAMPGPSRS